MANDNTNGNSLKTIMPEFNFDNMLSGYLNNKIPS
jgi:hypothetical protein